MKKQYDYEENQRRQYIVNDWFFNAFKIIVCLLAVWGLIQLVGKYAGPLVIASLIGGCMLYAKHLDGNKFFNSSLIEEHLRKPKFNYLSDQQIHEIILEIYHIL